MTYELTPVHLAPATQIGSDRDPFAPPSDRPESIQYAAAQDLTPGHALPAIHTDRAGATSTTRENQ